MRFTRPVRGAIRLDSLKFDPQKLRTDLERFGADDWHVRSTSDKWAEVRLIDKEEHPRLGECDAVQELLAAFPSRALDMSFAKIEPGGNIKEHRDFSGGVPMGVARFHIPVITNDRVEFYVSGERVRMMPGEVWSLDTTYLHRVANWGGEARTHVILDVELNAGVKKMLPPTDLRDRAHGVYFAGLCVAKGAQLAVRDPRAVAVRARDFVRLKFLRQSVLND